MFSVWVPQVVNTYQIMVDCGREFFKAFLTVPF